MRSPGRSCPLNLSGSSPLPLPVSRGSFVAVGGVVTLLATAAGLVTRLRGFFSPLVVVLVVLVAERPDGICPETEDHF